jgi:hypothetical protein
VNKPVFRQYDAVLEDQETRDIDTSKASTVFLDQSAGDFLEKGQRQHLDNFRKWRSQQGIE